MSATKLEAPVLIVGRGPVGMTLGLRLARLGVASTIVDRLGGELPLISKAVLMHRESAEILERAGVGREIAETAVALTGSRTYYKEHELFRASFPPPEPGAFPLLLNYPQSETERALLTRVEAEPMIDLRLGARLCSLDQEEGGVLAGFEEPEGDGLQVRAQYVAGCDGSRSEVRKQLGIEFTGHSHDDYYLIVDIRAKLALGHERRFAFDPPSNPGRTILIHPQHDDLWHLDYQVGAAPDIDAERGNGYLDERIRAVIGEVEYELVSWTSYVFKQLIADRFCDGRAFLVGDAGHLYAPYGARGLNSGLADADNLAWKLAAVLRDEAPGALLDTYDLERRSVAREHFRVTGETARFMAPTTRRGRLRRDLTLAAALRVPPLRRFVNSGHFYEPLGYPGSPVVSAAGASESGGPCPGELLPDLPFAATAEHTANPVAAAPRLRDHVGREFAFVHFAPDAAVADAVRAALPDETRVVGVLGSAPPAAGAASARSVLVGDPLGLAPERFHPDGLPAAGRLFLVRPDCHIASRHDLADAGQAAGSAAWLAAARGRHL
jgi:2-polyprenyl-6-methoxyphenol hydroxylase-like FAD-dependent oxidoreductase